jgi:hypothetical protein
MALGRPLNFILPTCFGKIGWVIGHQDGLYFLASLVNAVNALLLTLLLRRFTHWWLAVLGGLLFVVFPSDTTKMFLLNCSHVHASMFFCFAGLLLFFAGGWFRWLSYPVAAFSLLSFFLLYRDGPLRPEKTILSNSWADPLVLKQVVFWNSPPKRTFKKGIDPEYLPLLLFIDEFRSVTHFSSNQGETLWNPLFWSDKLQRLDFDEVIVLDHGPSGLRRVDQVTVPGLSFPLKSKQLNAANGELNGMRLTPYGKMLLGR